MITRAFFAVFGCTALAFAAACASDSSTPSPSASGGSGGATAGHAGAPSAGHAGTTGGAGKSVAGSGGSVAGSAGAKSGGNAGSNGAGATAGGNAGSNGAGATAGGNAGSNGAGAMAGGSAGAAASGGNNAGSDQGGADQGGTNQGGSDQGGSDRGGTNQGGSDQGGADQGGSDQGGAAGAPATGPTDPFHIGDGTVGSVSMSMSAATGGFMVQPSASFGANDQTFAACSPQVLGSCIVTVCPAGFMAPDGSKSPGVGVITAVGSGKTFTLTEDPQTHAYASTPDSAVVTTSLSGASVTFSATGGDIAAFSTALAVGANVTNVAPAPLPGTAGGFGTITIDQSKDFDLTWTPGTDGFVIAALVGGGSDGSETDVTCAVAATTGALTMPAAALALVTSSDELHLVYVAHWDGAQVAVGSDVIGVAVNETAKDTNGSDYFAAFAFK